ncbi:tetratricopeptide repeat protein [Metabacillus arenae]|uniref:Tetratricopeptide repeat protein n=1 Tax=Metabacillus arenae TaxID=2771434 RepID=A0A926NJJ0_9BACI|nr:hypothetical protein [Metabacillus arenae]MBD1382511.1 hypothetical protein [Metabacillus arenae]
MSDQLQAITIISHGQTHQITIKRMAIFHRMKIIEAISNKDEAYYLFFYKDQFITGKNTKVKRNSLLHKAFNQGIVFNSPHPLIDVLLPVEQTYQLLTINQIYKVLLKKYSPQETALILSFFDAFVPKEKIIEVMKKFYYHFRRKGQYRFAYQILIILHNYDPNEKWAVELVNHIDFLKYKLIYDERGRELQAKDPLYTEILSFTKREKEPYFSHLEAVLTKESRWADLISLYIRESTKSEQRYDQFLSLITKHFSKKDRIFLLQNNAAQMKQVPQELLDLLINTEQNEEAVNLLIEQPRENLAFSQVEQLTNLLDKDSLCIEKLHLENLCSYLTYVENEETIEKILQMMVPQLLKKFDLLYVHKWSQPLRKINRRIPILSMIQTMVVIQDDPDQQFYLGKLYHKLNQSKKAIECFNWEMELNPNDPEPVQWITKVYLELGMIEESNTYKKIYTSMQRVSG